MSLLSQYQNFKKQKKVYTINVWREYEGEGGYWNCYDEWIEGPTIKETYVKVAFLDFERALEYADKMQEEISDQDRIWYLNWYTCIFQESNKAAFANLLFSAYIDIFKPSTEGLKCGKYKMELTYDYIN